MRLTAGTFARLGASWDGRGTNFALFSAHAEKVELCLFDSQGRRELERIELPERSEDVWHGYLNDVSPGQLYGYRVHGPYAPEQGHRFNPAKLLLDPYARAVSGPVGWERLPGPAEVTDTDPRVQPSPDPRDTAGMMPKSIVIDPAFEWDGDRHPRTPWERTLIYKCHVTCVTMLHPGVPEELRGTSLGLATEPIIDNLQRLAVTAV